MSPAIDPTGTDVADLRARLEAAYARDPFSRALDLRVVELRPGEALLSAVIEGVKLNAHGSGHGGALWTLADMAFGAAAFHRAHILTVGSDLSFFRPAPPGATLFARARQITAKGATATFHIVLSLDPDDPATVVAAGSFTGRWPTPA